MAHYCYSIMVLGSENAQFQANVSDQYLLQLMPQHLASSSLKPIENPVRSIANKMKQSSGCNGMIR